MKPSLNTPLINTLFKYRCSGLNHINTQRFRFGVWAYQHFSSKVWSKSPNNFICEPSNSFMTPNAQWSFLKWWGFFLREKCSWLGMGYGEPWEKIQRTIDKIILLRFGFWLFFFLLTGAKKGGLNNSLFSCSTPDLLVRKLEFYK